MRCKIRYCNRRAVRNGYCNLHSKSTSGTRRSTATTYAPGSTLISTLGDTAMGYAQRKGAQRMSTYGRNMVLASATYIEPSTKTWSPLRASQVREYGGKVDRSTTLYRPEGLRNERPRRRRDHRIISNEDIHWERQPSPQSKSKLAKPHPYRTSATRARMRTIGITLYGTGKMVPIIGYTTLGYGLYSNQEWAKREQAKANWLNPDVGNLWMQDIGAEYTAFKTAMTGTKNLAKPIIGSMIGLL